ncbi:TPA: peptide-binding protein, partial [Candidatus Acetothermia bacterium]|nr:peptide-binding protein [Candidatus Acetothermia bacterium]
DRQAIYWELHVLLNELQAVSFMFFPESLVGVERRFRGVVPTAIGLLWNIEYWWVPEALQRY